MLGQPHAMLWHADNGLLLHQQIYKSTLCSRCHADNAAQEVAEPDQRHAEKQLEVM